MTVELTRSELRARARTVLDKLENIYDVRIQSIDCNSENPVPPGPFDISSSLRLRADVYAGERVETLAIYSLQAKSVEQSDEGDGETGTAWTLKLRIIGTWKLKEKIDDADADIESLDLTCFAIAVGSMTIHPYAREAVQSTVSRLGYPPYTMEILEPPAEGDPEDTFTITEFEGR